MSGEVQIRRMTLEDVDWAMALADSLHEAPRWPRTAYIAALNGESPERIALVGQGVDGSRMGFAVASAKAEAELEAIAVGAEFQRRGVGRSLMAALFDELQRRNAREIVLEVRASNLAAQTLYASVGFREAGRRRGYYANPPEDAVVLKASFF